MTLRASTTSYVPGSLCASLYPGFGVRGDAVPSGGTSGPAYAYPALVLPADASKEIRGVPTVLPADGLLVFSEDTSFTYTPAADGERSFQWQLFVDGLAVGAPQTVLLQVGVVASRFRCRVAGATVEALGLRVFVNGAFITPTVKMWKNGAVEVIQ